MSRRSRVSLWVLAAVAAGTAVALVLKAPRPRLVTSVVGVVLAQNADPRKQSPIANVRITAVDGGAVAESKSDSSGQFRLNLHTGIWQGTTVGLRFRHPDYQPLEMKGRFADRICVARLTPRARVERAEAGGPEVLLSDVRVRYAMKNLTMINIGSMVKTFEVANAGNVPCDHQLPCSPDHKWKAAAVSETFDAGEGHEFRNARVSCIAGPCPFTRIGSNSILGGGRLVRVSVLNWSDTVTFLFEAEVIHAMPADVIRELYPAIFGRNMNFTLPAAAQGPSVEAELNGAAIVFPLGPALNLSWAVCHMQVGTDKTKRFSCELRPGYRFR